MTLNKAFAAERKKPRPLKSSVNGKKMVQFLADIIDQLDTAIDQLAVSDRNFDRFAIMLIDNVVELTLYRYAQDKNSENKMWSWNKEKPPKYDPKALEKALGKRFDAKVKFAVKTGLIKETEGISLLNLHSFRNTAHHRGLHHEGILHSIAHFYFQNSCNLLIHYSPMWWSSGSNDSISHRAVKYIGKVDFLSSKEAFDNAWHRLNDVSISMKSDLIGDLHKDMKNTISSTDEMIQFLANDAPTKSTRDQVIIDSQAWPFAFTDKAKEFAQVNGYSDSNSLNIVEWIGLNYPWQIKSDPIASWRNRLNSLHSETHLHNALKKYCDFMTQTEDIRSKIYEAAAQLDAHIQQEIDRMRGK